MGTPDPATDTNGLSANDHVERIAPDHHRGRILHRGKEKLGLRCLLKASLNTDSLALRRRIWQGLQRRAASAEAGHSGLAGIGQAKRFLTVKKINATHTAHPHAGVHSPGCWHCGSVLAGHVAGGAAIARQESGRRSTKQAECYIFNSLLRPFYMGCRPILLKFYRCKNRDFCYDASR